MNVFLDTNVFYNDWFLRGASLRHLFHFINNDGHTLLLSRLVIEEVENKYRVEAHQALERARKAMSDLEKFGHSHSFFSEKVSTVEYDFLSLLRERVENIEIVEYTEVPQQIVVRRAISRTKPFREDEKGFRDTLIWLSLIGYINAQANASHRDTAFISHNSTDFFANGSEAAFHPDLTSELESKELSDCVMPYRSLPDFVKKNIDPDTHAIDRAKTERDAEHYLEDEALDFLVSRTPEVIKEFQRGLDLPSILITDAQGIAFEIVEGMEDFHIRGTAALDHSDILIDCDFNLRVVNFDLFVKNRDFHAYKDVIENSPSIYEMEIAGDTVFLKGIVRTYFSAGFAYNPRTGECSGFTVAELAFR